MEPALHIACRHTVDSNIAVFEAAAQGLDLGLSHVVRADLLSCAEAVLLTCSTVGPAAGLGAAAGKG